MGVVLPGSGRDAADVRFEQLHRGAIRYPANRFKYIGIDDEGDTDEHYTGEVSVDDT